MDTSVLIAGGGPVGLTLALTFARFGIGCMVVERAAGATPASWMPVLMAAGKINLVSIPKAKWEAPAFQKFLSAPGNAPALFPVGEFAHYGDNVRVISEDGMFRGVSATFGDGVHKDMPKDLAKALTKAFIDTVGELHKKAPFAKGLLFGKTDDKLMGLCNAKVTYHPGAVEA